MEALRPEDPAEIGGYPLLARLGAGGMGQVYLGLTAGGQHVALKVIREGFEGPQALARFRREVATVERVRSRAVAAMVAAGLDAPPYWLATEYVPGPTLRQAVAEHGALPPGLCLKLMSALAVGLAEIHQHGVQHRDLKPGNVILAPDGLRLIDFGIARGEDQTQITQTGAWNGTPGYVAPEVVREQQPVPASDVFSLAGTVAYAATGRPPFGGGRIEAIIHRTLNGDIDVDGAEPGLADLVRQCARKAPDDRMALERLIEVTADAGALATDPDYRRVVGAPPPVPGSVSDAAASGLVPADRTRTLRPVPRLSRTAVIAAGTGVVAVVLGGALIARFTLKDGGGEAPPAAQGAGAGTANGSPTGSSPTLRPSGGGTPGPGGRPPDQILVKNPTSDFSQVRYSQKDHGCLPAIRPEDFKLADDVQVSSPYAPFSGSNVDIGMRFKFQTPSRYYVAVQVRPPQPQQGNAILGVVQSKPYLVAANQFVTVNYPADFKWKGAGNGTYPLTKGTWTAIWLHVHPNGDAYYLSCDGFTIK